MSKRISEKTATALWAVTTGLSLVGALLLFVDAIHLSPIAIAGTFLVFAGTFLAYWFDQIRSEFHHERIASANERAAAAQLETEHLRREAAARRILEGDFLEYINSKDPPTMPVEILFSRDDPDSFHLASQLHRLLTFETRWPVAPMPLPIPLAERNTWPAATAIGGQSAGVSIVENPGAADRTPGGALKVALYRSLGQIAWSRCEDMPVGAVRVVIAPKMSNRIDIEREPIDVGRE